MESGKYVLILGSRTQDANQNFQIKAYQSNRDQRENLLESPCSLTLGAHARDSPRCWMEHHQLWQENKQKPLGGKSLGAISLS